MKAILKYCNYSSIRAMKGKTKSGSVFAFNHKTKDVLKDIKDLDVTKISQESDIPMIFFPIFFSRALIT